MPALGSVGVVLLALTRGGNFAPVLLGMSPIGVVLTIAAASYLRDPARTRTEWRVEHLISMLARRHRRSHASAKWSGFLSAVGLRRERTTRSPW